MNKIRFKFFNVTELSKLVDVIKLYKESNSYDNDRYVLVTNDKHEDSHYCIITDVLYEDIISYPEPGPVETYDSLISSFGPTMVSEFVHEDGKPIMDKIMNILSFTIDKVYKCDTIEVEIELGSDYQKRYLDLYGYQSSIPDLIFTVLMYNFIVIKQDIYRDIMINRDIRKIIIKKKEED